MLDPPLPLNDAKRVATLHNLHLLDTPPEERFDRITRLATQLFGVPIALISLVDENRQWFKSCLGLDVTETSRNISFCGHAILEEQALVISDAQADPRFADNPLVTGQPYIRFYAGQPLSALDGSKVGTLCIIDRCPRHFSENDLRCLSDLAALAQDELNNYQLNQAMSSVQNSQMRLQAVLDNVPDGIISLAENGVIEAFSVGAEQLFGYSATEAKDQLFQNLLCSDKLYTANLSDYLSKFIGNSSTSKDNPYENYIMGRCKDGSHFPMRLSVGEMQLDGKRVFTVVCQDITRYLQVQEEARKNARQLSAIIEIQAEIARVELNLNVVMQLIVERTQQLTEAAGAALEMAEGEEMVYRATSGMATAHLGIRLKMATTLSGLCVRTGQLFYCEDTTTDPRTDPEICRKIGIGSMVVVPLNYEGKIIGVLKVMSPVAKAFNNRDIQTLQLMAGLLAATMSHATEFEARQTMLVERTNTLMALQESEARFKSAFNFSAIAMAMVAIDGHLIQVNQVFCEMLGYTEQELLSMNSQSITHTEDANKDFSQENRLLNGEIRHFELEQRYYHKQGHLLWVLLSCSLVSSHDGKPLYFISQFQDISERKRTEEALRESEERLRTVISNVPIVLYALDQQGTLTLSEGKGLTTLGLVPGQGVGRSVFELCKDFPQIIKDNKRALAGEHFSSVVELGGLTFESWYAPLLALSGEVKGVIGVSTDITKRKQAEEVLTRQTQELARSNSELEQFAYVASHDLQEPLRMVASYTQLLAKRYKGQLDADADEFIGYAVDGVARMRVLINDLLTFSRVGTRNKNLEPTDCEIVLADAVTNLQVVIAESKAVVTHDPLPTVQADTSQLGQLFQNLVGNALKFRKADQTPHVHISAVFKNKEWVFAFQDNGIGLDPQFAERIFIIFQRLHGRNEYSGTGIGLAICKKIVERHNGKIWVESQPNQGATFYFTLPA